MLLIEAAYTPERAASEGMTFTVEKTKWGRGGYQVVCTGPTKQLGAIKFNLPMSDMGRCLDAYEVTHAGLWAWAPDGLGPLLYDIALEITGDAGLMSDRRSVSTDARNVWKHYFEKRSSPEGGDVTFYQLDSLADELTPGDPKDNCVQDAGGIQVRANRSDFDKVDWRSSPLSKAYKKKGTPVIDKLKSLGIITFV